MRARVRSVWHVLLSPGRAQLYRQAVPFPDVQAEGLTSR